MEPQTPSLVYVDELVVNWHILESCNYHCRYCYAKWEKPDHPELWRSPSDTYRLLESLYTFFNPGNYANPLRYLLHWDTIRLSLAGGEPTLLGERLVDVARQAHQLGFSISIISNGSRLNPDYVQELAPYLTVLGLSVDSSDLRTNKEIGRVHRGTSLNEDEVFQIVNSARRANPAISIKINTVVTTANADTDMSSLISRVQPDRWKVMRMLPVLTTAMEVNDSRFTAFVDRHIGHSAVMCVENNEDMAQSYVMVDPHGRFFQNADAGRGYIYSPAILAVGADRAFGAIPFSPPTFASRYANTKHDVTFQ